jgi:hypothetical protein
MSRNSVAMIAAAIAVVAAIVLGFWNLGSPARERVIHQDLRTVQALNRLAGQIQSSWRVANRVLPANLERFAASAKEDPTTRAPFVYHAKSGSQYELCATFLTDNRKAAAQDRARFWAHPSGPYCFTLDASVSPPPPPYYYPF